MTGAEQLTAEQLALTDKLAAKVAAQLVTELRDAGLPAARAATERLPQPNDVVIRGNFVSVDEGRAGKRMLVGFGSGNAKLMTAVDAIS